MNRMRRHQLRLASEISITPLLDLVFILLFAFIVAAPLIAAREEAAPPEQESASATQITRSVAPEKQITLTILANQSYEWDGDLVPAAELAAHATRLASEAPEAGVILQVDRGRPVEQLVHAMEVLDQSGIRHTAIQVSPAP